MFWYIGGAFLPAASLDLSTADSPYTPGDLLPPPAPSRSVLLTYQFSSVLCMCTPEKYRFVRFHDFQQIRSLFDVRLHGGRTQDA